jgi:ABC-2 type transport system ATP-binding protein
LGEPAIKTDGLSRSFRSVTALRDLNLRVPYGVIYGLIGPNGAGKTTALRLLLGLLHPSSGQISVLGHDPVKSGNRARCSIGVVLEPGGLYENMTAWENLDYYGRIWHMPTQERKVRAQELLEQMRLWHRRNEVVLQWSRGLKQRLCIARSLLHSPPVLLLDEPNAGLDSPTIDEIYEYLQYLVSKRGMTVLLATNNLSVAESTCHSITILNEGRTLASGRTERVCALGSVPQVEICGRGFTDDVVALLLRRPEVVSACRENHGLMVCLAANVDIAPLVSLLVESGADVTEVRKTRLTLKSAFDALLQHNLPETISQ